MKTEVRDIEISTLNNRLQQSTVSFYMYVRQSNFLSENVFRQKISLITSEKRCNQLDVRKYEAVYKRAVIQKDPTRLISACEALVFKYETFVTLLSERIGYHQEQE